MSAMCFNYTLANGQPQPCAGCSRRSSNTVKLVKDMLQMLVKNRRAFIANFDQQHRMIILHLCRHMDNCLRRRVLKAVADQVAEDLLHQDNIEWNQGKVFWHVEPDQIAICP